MASELLATTPESLHLAICQAVAILNCVPDPEAINANRILRQALNDYVERRAQPQQVGEFVVHRACSAYDAAKREAGFAEYPAMRIAIEVAISSMQEQSP